MAKIIHPDFIDSVNEIIKETALNNCTLLKSENQTYNGDFIKIKDSNLLNFGSCNYLGLEQHPKVKRGTIEATENYGTQFSISRTYITNPLLEKLEYHLKQIFSNTYILTYSSTSLAHYSILPLIVNFNDLVIVDQQAHISMQSAVQILISKGIRVEFIKHNKMEILEDRIKINYNKFNKIWFITDGVFSMFGDTAPINNINNLLHKYDRCFLYMDDAHGMSWHGSNGSGKLYDQCLINKKTMYITTLSKGFGTMGGIAVFPNSTIYNRVALHGGALSYSHPIPPPMIGASIASALIHLDQEIYHLQEKLRTKIELVNSKLAITNLPVITKENTPIYFIALSKPKFGYNLVNKMFKDGFYVNLSTFPVVPQNKAGIRFTITNNLSDESICEFIDSLNKNYFEALKEEELDLNDILAKFNINQHTKPKSSKTPNDNLRTIILNDINLIDKKEWDNIKFDNPCLKWDNLSLLQESFTKNKLIEHNFQFHFIIIKNIHQDILGASFLSSGVLKDDMLLNSHISETVEKTRLNDKYYLCSRNLIMGSILTEGNNIFIKDGKQLIETCELMHNSIMKLFNEINCNRIIFRDFPLKNSFTGVLEENGYLKINMPPSNTLQLPHSIHDYINSITGKNKYHFAKDILKDLEQIKFSIKNKLSKSELNEFYNLYLNVHHKNKSLNLFTYPYKLFVNINRNPNWEFIKAKVNDKTLSIACANTLGNTYNPVIIGLDYNLNKNYKIYKKMLFKFIERGILLNKRSLNFGISSDLEKRKLGAISKPQFGYLLINENTNNDQLNQLL